MNSSTHRRKKLALMLKWAWATIRNPRVSCCGIGPGYGRLYKKEVIDV